MTTSADDPMAVMAREVNAMVAGTSLPQAPPAGASNPGVLHSFAATGSGAGSGDRSGPGAGLPTQQASGLAAQAVAQSMAIAVQDAVDLLRNISTIETTAIGAATAKWIAEPENVFYPTIIATSTETLSKVADILKTIGANTAAVLGEYESRS